MNQENIIPSQIPPDILKEKRYDDIILFSLSAFGPLERSEFINSPINDIEDRMNKNTFYKWVKELRNSNYIEVKKEERRSVYSITKLGLDELLRRLKRYQLDFDTVSKIEQQRIKRYIKSIKQFFIRYEVYNEDIKAEFIEIANVITHDKLDFFPEIKFNKLLLFITLNHPKFYPIFTISKSDFIKTYKKNIESENEELTITDIDMFIQRIFEEKIYDDKIYLLQLKEEGKSLYFRVNGEYGSLLQTILKTKFKYLYNLNILEIIDLNNDWLEDAYEDILNILIDKLKCFNEDLRESLKKLLNEFKSKLIEEIKKNPLVDRESIPYYYFTNIIDSEDVHFSQKYEVKEEKELEKKLKDINDKLKDKPLNHENLLLKSEILYRLNKEAEALITINKALKLKPQNLSKYLKTKAIILPEKLIMRVIGSGLEFSGKKKLDFLISFIKYTQTRSLKLIKKAIQLDENSQNLPLFFQIQADILMQLSQNEEALSSINKAIELNNKFINSEKENLVGYENFYKIKSLILFRLKKVEESKKLIEKAKKERKLPIEEEIKYYSRINDYEKAISIINTLIKENPEDLKHLKKKALYLAEDCKYEESNAILDFLLDKEENKSSILRKKLRNYFAMGDYDNAINILDQVYKSTPTERIHKFEDLFRIYNNKKNYKEALYILNKIIESDLDRPVLLKFYLSKSRILIKLKKFKEALQLQDNLIHDYSDDSEEIVTIKANKALVLAKLGRIESGINLIESLLSNNSEQKDFLLYNYGKVLIALNEYEDAIKKFQEALKIKPKSISIYFKIAKCYEKVNDFKSALENLNNVKKIAQKKIKEGKSFRTYYDRQIEKANKKIEELKVQDALI